MRPGGSALIAPSGVTVFAFASCPFCKEAVKLLDEQPGAGSYALINLDEREDGAALRARLGARTGRTSVPSIWLGGECIGGLNDGTPGLVPLKASGALEERLRDAGAVA